MYRTNQGFEIKRGRRAFFFFLLLLGHGFTSLLLLLLLFFFFPLKFTSLLALFAYHLSPSDFLNFFLVYATCWEIVSLGQVIDSISFILALGREQAGNQT